MATDEKNNPIKIDLKKKIVIMNCNRQKKKSEQLFLLTFFKEIGLKLNSLFQTKL